MRKSQVKAGPGRSWVGPGRSRAGPGDFFEDFWRSGGPKKKVAFPESKSNETFRNQLSSSKNRKSIVNSWFYSRKTIIISNFLNPKKNFLLLFLAGPVAGRPAPGPGSRAGPGIIEKPARQPGSRHRARAAGDPAPGYGISVSRVH